MLLLWDKSLFVKGPPCRAVLSYIARRGDFSKKNCKKIKKI